MSLVHRVAALAGALAFAGSAAQAAVSYLFTVDTSSIAGTAGYLDMQLSADVNAPLRQTLLAQVSGFSTDGALGGEDPYTTVTGGFPDILGNLSGTLPGVVKFTDPADVNTNDYFQSITFGTTLSFRVTLLGPALDNPLCAPGGGCAIHSFVLDLLDPNFSPLLNDPSDPSSLGFLLGRVDVASGGAVSTASYSPNLSLDVVPEPATWGLMLLGFLGIGSALRRRLRASRVVVG